MVKTSNFPQLRNSRGSLNFRNKRRAGQNYLVELMVAKREEGGEVKERRKKDKRRVERTMAWNGVDRKMPRFPTLTQVSDRVHFALLTRPFPPRAFHLFPSPFFYLWKCRGINTTKSDVWNLRYFKSRSSFSLGDEPRVRFNFCSINFNLTF